MYNVNESIDSESGGANFLDVGIHDDVELTSVEYKVSSEGNEFMVFTFEKDGKKVTLTEWRPKDEDAERLESKTKNQIKRVKHIVTKFIPENQYVFNATDFKSFCENTIKLLGSSFIGKQVRLKVTYSWNNYTTLPNYTPFIEKSDVKKADSKLEILSIDKMKKDNIADTDYAEKNPFAKSGNGDTKTDNAKADVEQADATSDTPF